ncbi:MAG: TCP-1/cpn60 chaperonin family protein [Euryarchaeota archaeon]|nr:TCP-1/cpn60 chaperonin family protein [Euryarchaeota archaeon]
MSGQLGGTPIFILKEGSERTRGREAQGRNILAAKAVAAAVRSTLGPKGMDKMLVDTLGDVVITNDGATILKEIEIEHPAAKMLVEVAKTQDDEVGDGTTTAVILAGELLEKAEGLIDQQVHPTVIVSGYQKAAVKAVEVLNGMAVDISPDDRGMLKKVAMTSIAGKSANVSLEHLADIAVRACLAVRDTDKGKVDIENINVVKKVGAKVESTEMVEGMAIEKERVHKQMPKRVESARILLLNVALEIEKTEVDAEIKIRSPDQMKMFLDEEEDMMKRMVEKIKATGANVVFCQKGIEDIPQHFLAKASILAARRVKKSDMEKLTRATGGRLVTNLDEVSKADLGAAGLVEERKYGDDEMLFVEKCKNPKAVSILLRGGTEHVVDEVERGLHDALRVVGVAIEQKRLLPGGGAPETEVGLRLREYAASVGGREQMAIEVFADALQVIPRTLAENAGLDPIDMVVELRSQHEKGNKTAGLDVYKGKATDMLKAGVLEPLKVKTQAIASAVEASNMLLRIDDVIASGKGAKGGPPGGPGGDHGDHDDGGGSDFD